MVSQWWYFHVKVIRKGENKDLYYISINKRRETIIVEYLDCQIQVT